MNTRAHDLTVLLRGILGTLPGATSIGLHASERWAFVLITAASDEAVVALGEALGLTNDWALRIIKHVGNYGEAFERNVGQGSPLKISRGQNGLWTKGGLQYAPPIR